MLKSLLVILTVITIGLAALCVVQWRELSDHRQRERVLAEAHHRELQDHQARSAETEQRAERLQRSVDEFSSVTTQLRATEATQRSNLTALAGQAAVIKSDGTSSESTGVFGKEMGDMLSTMMKDPEMR